MKKPIQRKWFHATTIENYKKIQKEGVLFGKNDIDETRRTFLARNLAELIRMINLSFFRDLAKCELILTVKYTPNRTDDDYNPKYWEMIVYKPIPISDVKVLKYL